MSRIECKWAKSFVLPHLHSTRLMWSKASEPGLLVFLLDRWITSETFHDICANRCCTGHATMSTTVSNIFANSLTSFRFLFFSKTTNPHNLDNNRPHIVDRSYRGRTKVAFYFSKKRCVFCYWPIAPSSVDIVAWPMQRRFAHRGKFRKLFNDWEEIVGSLRKRRRQRQRERC